MEEVPKPTSRKPSVADHSMGNRTETSSPEAMRMPLARSTLANVVLGGVLAARHGLQRVALVSDDFHLWRALRLYQRVWGRAPTACLPSGERGSVYLRLREKTVFALQMGALQLAGVAPGNWRAHLAFVCPGLACP